MGGSSTLWVLLAMAFLLVPAAGAQLPCQEGLPGCPESPDQAAPPEAPLPSGAAPPAPTDPLPKATPLDRIVGGIAYAVGGAVDGLGAGVDAVGDAFASAGHALVRFMAAIGGFLGGAVAGLAAWISSLRPNGMDPVAYAALASAGTAVAVSGASVGLWMGLKRLLPFLSLVPGFSRITKDELLDNGRRAALFELIKHNPGIRLSQIARDMDLAWGTAIHHLRKLRADRLVTFKPVGAHKCYFVNGSGLSELEMAAASHLKADTPAAIAQWLGTNPNASLKDLAKGVGISSPLAAFHVGKLTRAGLVTKVRDGRSVRLALAPRPNPALVSAMPSPVAAS